MEIEIDDREARVVIAALRKIPRAMTRPLWAALRTSAQDVAGDTRRLLRGRRGTSRPGEPPARRTGLLARSIRTRRGRDFSYQILTRPDAFHGRFLETGTAERRTRRRGRRGRLEPRPFLTAALAARRDAVEAQDRRGDEPGHRGRRPGAGCTDENDPDHRPAQGPRSRPSAAASPAPPRWRARPGPTSPSRTPSSWRWATRPRPMSCSARRRRRPSPRRSG